MLVSGRVNHSKITHFPLAEPLSHPVLLLGEKKTLTRGNSIIPKKGRTISRVCIYIYIKAMEINSSICISLIYQWICLPFSWLLNRENHLASSVTFLVNWVMFRFHFNFQGCIQTSVFLFFSMLGVQVSQLSFLPTKNQVQSRGSNIFFDEWKLNITHRKINIAPRETMVGRQTWLLSFWDGKITFQLLTLKLRGSMKKLGKKLPEPF